MKYEHLERITNVISVGMKIISNWHYTLTGHELHLNYAWTGRELHLNYTWTGCELRSSNFLQNMNINWRRTVHYDSYDFLQYHLTCCDKALLVCSTSFCKSFLLLKRLPSSFGAESMVPCILSSMSLWWFRLSSATFSCSSARFKFRRSLSFSLCFRATTSWWFFFSIVIVLRLRSRAALEQFASDLRI